MASVVGTFHLCRPLHLVSGVAPATGPGMDCPDHDHPFVDDDSPRLGHMVAGTLGISFPGQGMALVPVKFS